MDDKFIKNFNMQLFKVKSFIMTEEKFWIMNGRDSFRKFIIIKLSKINFSKLYPNFIKLSKNCKIFKKSLLFKSETQFFKPKKLEINHK